jgi:hypothetical protein
MPYTSKCLAAVWLVTFGLFFLSGSGVVAGSSLVLLSLVLLATAALLLRSSARLMTTIRKRLWVITDERDRSALDLGGIEVQRWENEGGARLMLVTDGIRSRPLLPGNASLGS